MASLAPVVAPAAIGVGRRVEVNFARCEELLPGELDLIAALLGDDLAALLTVSTAGEPNGAGRDHRARASAR